MSEETHPVSKRLRARSRAHPARPVVDHARPFQGVVPGSSVQAVRQVVKFDGRSRIVAARRPGASWCRMARGTALDRSTAEALRVDGISEVIVQRGLRRASFPLGWMSRRD